MEPILLQIPVARIRPNPNNSRPVITHEMIEIKKASLEADGQLDPIKVRPLTQEEKASDPEHDYELIGGHIRLEAAKSLGWETLRALVFAYTPAEAVLPGIMDNKGQERHWFCKYLDIEVLLKVYPDLSQRQLANRLEMSKTVINEGLKLLKFLNPSARELVVRTANITEPATTSSVRSADTTEPSKASDVRTADTMETPEDPWELAEAPVYCLMDLANPQMSLEDIQDLILKALKVVIDRQMSESQVEKLVVWIEKGNSPESFEDKAEQVPNEDPNDPHSSYWTALPPNVKVTRTKKGYEVHASLAHNEGVPVVYGMLSNLEHLKLLSKEPHDPQFRSKLEGVMEEGRKARITAREEVAKQEAERQAALQAKAQAKARKVEAKAQKAAARKQGRQTTADSAKPTLTNGEGEGFVEKTSRVSLWVRIAEILKQKTGMDGGDVVDAVEGNLWKDLKSAINTVIKQIIRRFLKRAF